MKDFDELLDRVLRQDAAAQPRAGLEGRVMARVREEERLPQGFILRYLNRWRGWILVPAAACLGIVAMIWYMAGGGLSQPKRTALREASAAYSDHFAVTPKVVDGSQGMESDGGSSLGRSGRASRDAHLSDGRAVAKMGHPVMFAHRVRSLPKLDVFPSPAPVGVFPRPVPASNEGQLAALVTKSEKIGAALATLKQEQNEAIRIAAIEITPLQIDVDTTRDQ